MSLIILLKFILQLEVIMSAILKSGGYVRWLMIILFAIGVILNYVDRNALGIMAQ